MARPVRSADIAELRAFCAAVDLGSLGRAARLLRVTQPALSKRLRTLEALAGASLLDRSSRGVTPTAAGTRLYLEARKLLAQAEAVEELMAGLSREDAPIRLAASHTIAEFVLPAPLVEFERRRERHLSVELVVLCCLGALLSSSAGPIVASSATVGLYLIGHGASDLYTIAGKSKSELVQVVGKALYWVIPQLDRLDYKLQASYRIPVPWSDVAVASAYGLGYAIVALVLAIVVFERVDFK